MKIINLTDKLVLVKDKNSNTFKNRTNQIEKIEYDEDYYYVTFTNSQKRFTYNKYNLKILLSQKDISVTNNVPYFFDNILLDIKELVLYDENYYKATLIDGREIVSDKVNNKIIGTPKIKDYYQSLFEYAGTVAEKETPLDFLAKNYLNAKYDKKSSLDHYFNQRLESTSNQNAIIVPFNYNQSQYKAILNAVSSNISIIEGPPGTGKTQTILNLLANIVYRNKTCAVVSNNNAAIINIKEKLQNNFLSSFIAQLGSKENTDYFFSNEQTSLEELKSKKLNQTSNLENKINTLHERIKYLQDLKVKTAILKEQLRDIKNVSKHHGITKELKTKLNQKLKSREYIKFIYRLQNENNTNFFMRLLIYVVYKVDLKKDNHHDIIQDAKAMYYVSKKRELEKQIKQNEVILKENNITDKIKQINHLSSIALENHLIKRARNIKKNTFTSEDYKNMFELFVEKYPIVLSTTQSLQNNKGNDYLFDYLIIDEASQADILKSTLSLNSAKNVVVVGDLKQLAQIEEELLIQRSLELEKLYDVPKSYSYSGNSILSSIKQSIKNVPVVLLKEHYRSAPDIIQFCNKMFYHNQLVAMTENQKQHIEIIKTVPGNHARSNPNGSGIYNQREIDEVVYIVENSPYNEIGVITPFRYQANLIENEINKLGKNVQADTVHKFQGREKESIIFSLTVNELEEYKESNHLKEFVNDERLINVSISRSIDKITLIVSDKVYYSKNNLIKDFIDYAEYIYGNQVSKESGIKSVFDNLYKEYKKIVINKIEQKHNEHQTEILMSKLIDKILKEYSFLSYSMHIRVSDLIVIPKHYTEEEKQYLNHPWTHVDFLFYNNVTKKTLFIIEVDGIKYHEQNSKQLIKDAIKDKAFKDNEIEIFRFKTNESNEEEKIKNIIENMINN